MPTLRDLVDSSLKLDGETFHVNFNSLHALLRGLIDKMNLLDASVDAPTPLHPVIHVFETTTGDGGRRRSLVERAIEKGVLPEGGPPSDLREKIEKIDEFFREVTNQKGMAEPKEALTIIDVWNQHKISKKLEANTDGVDRVSHIILSAAGNLDSVKKVSTAPFSEVWKRVFSFENSGIFTITFNWPGAKKTVAVI